MFLWRLPGVVCLLSVCACVALAYEDELEITYGNNYENEITQEEATQTTQSSAPCQSSDQTKWDKVFSMLENSQMRENMLLQYTSDIVNVEMGSLRDEMLKFVAQYAGSCGTAVETGVRQMGMQIEARLQETLKQLKPGDLTSAAAEPAENPNHLEATLQQLLTAAQTQASRLSKIESSCLSSSGAVMGMNPKAEFLLRGDEAAGHSEQEVTSGEASLDGVLAALQGLRDELKELKTSRQRSLPAGCDMALLFPMRSRRIYTAVLPDASLSLTSFTVCMWFRSNSVSNKAVLLSYGSRQNPYETQLMLNQTSARLTVRGEAHLVEARDVVKTGQWCHLCGTWSSEQGLATLWADGKKVASSSGVAEGYVLPAGGSLQLGQERNGCCSSATGFEASFDPELAFAGTMTAVNIWDRVLLNEEISQMALQQGQGCQQRGTVVAWGVTEMVPHGGAQFIN